MKVTIPFVTALASLASAGSAAPSKQKPDVVTSEISSTGKIDARNLEKRVVRQGDCSPRQWSIVTAAMGNCKTLARNAARAAVQDYSTMEDYFGGSQFDLRDRVKFVFEKVAQGCSGDHSRSGVPNFAIACWRTPVQDCFIARRERGTGTRLGGLNTPQGPIDVLNICPKFFQMEARSGRYELQDQSSLLIHEMTRVTVNTENYNFYYSDYPFEIPTSRIPDDRKPSHADTYAYFAQAVEYLDRGVFSSP